MQNTVLDRVNSPKDLQGLNINELKLLAEEMRQLIIKKVNTTGGHLSPNLGMVEATIALHYVFNSPDDKIVFDVSHQCYPHKILTGRKDGFTNPDNYLKYTGYTAPEESGHDLFKIGHTSTSVSLALGLAKGRDLTGGSENIVAVIGDGSLSGGEAYEGLNNAAVSGSSIIIIVNDNDMSIAENHGGLYSNLKLLRETGGRAECNFFKALGFEYHYIDEGHDIEKLIDMFKKVKDKNYPVLVHMHTTKGKGLKIAETDRENYHWIIPGALDEKEVSEDKAESYNSLTVDLIERKYKENMPIIAISPATPGVCGFDKNFRERAGVHYTDVGIAEEHAVAFASGIAKNGGKPILSVMSSFIQRTYDQLSQDLALNNTPAVLLIYWGGISSADVTHLTVFDIPLISNIPNMVYLAPSCKEEYLKMLDWAMTERDYPAAIRVPAGEIYSSGVEDDTDYSILNKYKVEEEGSQVAILGLGNFLHLGKRVKEALSENLGINAALINPRFITGIDEDLLNSLKSRHQLVITLEDGVLDGGFGEKISRFYGNSDMKVLNYGAKKEFTDRVPLEELYERYRLTPRLITEDVKNCLHHAGCCI